MITIYTTDSMGVYVGHQQISKYAAIPKGSSFTPPPDAPIVQLQGGAWVVLSAYPTPSAPPLVVPASITMRQARLALLGAGLLDNVDAAIAALPSPQKEAAKIEWEYSQEVHRHNGFVSVLAPILGMTAEQTDALFIGAANL